MLSQQCKLAAGTELQPQVRFGVLSCSRDMSLKPHCDLESQVFLTCLVPKQCWTKDLSLNYNLFRSGPCTDVFILWMDYCLLRKLLTTILFECEVHIHALHSVSKTNTCPLSCTVHIYYLIEQILNCSKSSQSANTVCKASTAPIQTFKVARK